MFDDPLSQQDNSSQGWDPLGRRPSQLPHPSEVHQSSNKYTFPPANDNNTMRRNSYHNLFHIPQEPMLPEVTEVPFYRQQRSMSFSFGQPAQKEKKRNNTDNNDDDDDDDDLIYSTNHHLFLDTIIQEDEEDEDFMQFERTRSKSSAMINDIWHPTSSLDNTTNEIWMNNKRRFSLIPPPPLYNNEMHDSRQGTRRFSLAPISSTLLER